MYETLVYWETAHLAPGQSEVARDFTEIWQAANKVVYSRTLRSVSSARTRIERDFDPEAVPGTEADLRARHHGRGAKPKRRKPLGAGLVDELQLFAVPSLVGGAKHWLPDGLRIAVELTEVRHFAERCGLLAVLPAS